ncbi:MAG: Xaa-Pro peptidase family protein [Clostridiales bacterium]|jgi:Xaa-Pro aminopeptidase|nr:Xaa-Pro peptidase family protein [Clostridiales bacterium]
MQPIIIEPRIKALRQRLRQGDFDAMLVVNEANVSYMSGFTNHDSFLFISGDNCGAANIFITDSRYIEQAEVECPDYSVMLYRNPNPTLAERMRELCAAYGVKRLAFERAHISYNLHEEISTALKETEFLPGENLIEDLRYLKDAAETERLRLACACTDKVFADICTFIKPGLTERDLEWALLQSVHKHGCEPSFPFIVVSGARGSLPHGKADNKELAAGEFVTMDFGCMYKGYHADMTRTVFIGQPTNEQRRLYDIVLSANLRAEEALRAGVMAQAVDAIARDHIGQEGYGENFGHGLGHGVGLDIHERPFMSRISEDRMEKGCVITVEPGIYLPGKCGIRIEDTVLVREDGCENLFSSAKELLCL